MREVPIGICTKDRVGYLDIMLRSLSGTQLPEDVSVTIFDDGSTDAATRRYYETQETIPCVRKWPEAEDWREKLGLRIVSDAPPPVGIAGRVPVVDLGTPSKGVVEGSREAACRMFAAAPAAKGIFVLQDDIVFKEDWYVRMTETVAACHTFADEPVGVLAGIKLNTVARFPEETAPRAVASGITAQCLYISREFFEAVPFFKKHHTHRTRWDDRLKWAANAHGFWGGVCYPGTCQHFGVASTVRPHRRWRWRPGGRVSYCVHPPYTMAKEVRQFA